MLVQYVDTILYTVESPYYPVSTYDLPVLYTNRQFVHVRVCDMSSVH